MPIDTLGKLYNKRTAEWEMLRDILDGEATVKDKGDVYLPKLTEQSVTSYNAYKRRGYLYDAVDKTRGGFLGAVMRKPATYVVPSELDKYMNEITIDKNGFTVLVSDIVDALLSFGFYGVLADGQTDADGSVKPYASTYSPLDIINCKVEIKGGREVLTFLALREMYEEQNPDDPYETFEKEQIRELKLENGVLQVTLWRKNDKGEWVRVNRSKEGEEANYTVTAKRFGGVAMDCIPFVFFGAIKNTRIPPKPPLIGIAYLTIKHYQLSCDYFHGLHFCALPTPYAFGLSDVKTEFFIGPEKALMDSNPQAKCGYLEFTGTGLTSVRTAMQDLKREMAILGARILEEQKNVGEAADTIEHRSQGDTATLSSVVTSTEQGLVQVLKYMCKWMGLPEESEIVVSLNKDFISSKLSSSDLLALLQALQAGEISQDTFLYNLKVGEILPDDTSIEDEKDKIDLDNAKRMASSVDLFSTPPKNTSEEDIPEEEDILVE
jgi:hypothetical protein